MVAPHRYATSRDVRPVGDPATYELATLARVRQHLRLDLLEDGTHEDDELLRDYMAGARDALEQFTGRALVERTVDAYYRSDFTDIIELPLAPVRSVASISYTGPDGVVALVPSDVWELDAHDSYPTLNLIDGESWPTMKNGRPFVVRFTAGYDDPAAPGLKPLPAALRSAFLLIVGELYANRELSTTRGAVELPLGVQALATPYRVNMGV